MCCLCPAAGGETVQTPPTASRSCSPAVSCANAEAFFFPEVPSVVASFWGMLAGFLMCSEALSKTLLSPPNPASCWCLLLSSRPGCSLLDKARRKSEAGAGGQAAVRGGLRVPDSQGRGRAGPGGCSRPVGFGWSLSGLELHWRRNQSRPGCLLAFASFLTKGDQR